MTTIYYTASSLDGFIADPDNSLSWLLSRVVDGSGPLGYDGFIGAVGAMAMGATTYEWIRANQAGSWPYTIPCWVFTHRSFDEPGVDDIRFTTGSIPSVHAEMVRAAAGRNVWLVGGGDLVGQFADHELLDEVWVQYAPITLGSGAPLLPRRIEYRYEELAQNGELACARLAVARRTDDDPVAEAARRELAHRDPDQVAAAIARDADRRLQDHLRDPRR